MPDKPTTYSGCREQSEQLEQVCAAYTWRWRVAPVGAKEQQAAAELLRRYSDQDLTFADAVGLHLMAANEVQCCWSTDFHLELTGVPLVIHQC